MGNLINDQSNFLFSDSLLIVTLDFLNALGCLLGRSRKDSINHEHNGEDFCDKKYQSEDIRSKYKKGFTADQKVLKRWIIRL